VGLCGVMGLRAVTALLEPPPLGIYSYSPMQAVYLASYSFGILLLSISAILLATEQLRGELERLLKHDTLTGALTRRAAFEHAADEMARCARTGASFSVLLLDLDHFKDINDRYGHQAGDRVLAEFVHRVEAVLRRPAALGRCGGEEFLVVLPDTDPAQALQVAERIRQRLRESTAEPRVTASIGVATFRGGHDTLDAVIGRGDAALYAAKHQGRDRIEVEAPAA
ncbi:GGDEF domain-containing protein, partial [Aquabacterium sp. A08]|uniref:GGDEF domain-containing protein n=1 Tax=Aquabacterium sp. A08 TaxID=2718532 RepID=UPI001423615A